MTDLINIYDDTNSIRNVPYKFLWLVQMGYKETSSILVEVYVLKKIEKAKKKKEDNK